MDRLCERPGCSERASVAYGMRAEDLVFWLDFLPDDSRGRGGALCRRHADSMVVPRGWTLDDLRDPDLHLFRPPTQAVQAAQAAPPVLPASTARRRRAERRRERQADQLRLDAPPNPVAVPPAPPAAPADSAAVHSSEPPLAPATVTVPVDTVPVDTVPVETVPVETVPVETVESVAVESVAVEVTPTRPETAASGHVQSVTVSQDDVPIDAHRRAEAAVDVDVDVDADVDAEAPPLPPWTPDFDEADDLGGLLAARSPLLARAFRTADRGD